MRKDALGLFWRDEPPVKKEKADKVKCTPPDPTWLADDYLPGLQEALAFNAPLFTLDELVQAGLEGHLYGKPHKLVFDIECYWNYYLAAFSSISTGKVVYFELGAGYTLDIAKLKWVLDNFLIVTFNGIKYDLVITALAIAGKSTEAMKEATNQIILEDARGQDILKRHKAKKLDVNHIDLLEVAPLFASLKIYGGRLHCPRMQDLPFHPEKVLTPEQIAITRWYCVNDLKNTALLHDSLGDELELRDMIYNESGIDVRSKSDAQIAEYILADEIGRINGERCRPPVIPVGTRYRYKIPPFIQYSTPNMLWVLELVRNTNFIVGMDGAVGMPVELSDLQIPIGTGLYRMGIGGLHSTEHKVSHVATPGVVIADRDVVSYYPFIILNQNLFPVHLGPAFLKAFSCQVYTRIEAKRDGKKKIANSRKIIINGTFGKLGSQYSIFYSPDLLIQVTLTGQLCLLMLIERFTLAGFEVLSANTDGVVTKFNECDRPIFDAIVKQWERETNFETEETLYKGLYSRDVNNYIAVKTDGKTKNKGAYAETGLQKNPTNWICVEAANALLTEGTPVAKTITECTDIRKFITVRKVNGGAVKNGHYLGNSIRWYYGAGETGTIIYAKSGKKVPKSAGAIPLMDMPEVPPTNIDYDWYIQEAERILKDVGYQ